eukprot:TRINITY_DN2504_c0_g1_i2.p1 TRINITY_DN2504_c0_g1~~TRINITY_DN2504_c0_g1_i2.p1  ORF type:complete len:382 (+),score=54.47 TRINITY_DN2504_c0_g1_i2:3-1148(+)
MEEHWAFEEKMADQFIRDFPFLKEKIEENPNYLLTKEDLEKIAEEINMSDSIQQFGIPASNRNGTRSYNYSSDLNTISIYSPIFNALALNTSITTLDLNNWSFIDLMAKVIMLNNTITDLNLSEHKFGPELINAIRMNSVLQTLNLSYCYCDNETIQNTRGASLNLISLNIAGNYFKFKHVAEWLKSSVNLTSLTISDSQITGDDTFNEWFPKRSKLTELNLICIDKDFKGIEECLKIHGKLQKFTLKNANYWIIEDEPMLLLDSLSFNKDLHYLDLNGSFRNPVYSASINQLINGLPLLTELNLSHNLLDCGICEALRQNSTLIILNLCGSFKEEDIAKVCEALENHPTLTWLNLEGRPYSGSKDGISAIAKLLQTQIPL